MAVLASFLGAFLLFALQPIVGKSLLPIYGGGAGAWIACMLFFQLVLLGGYAYAHGIAKRLGRPSGLRIHGLLALISLVILAEGIKAGGAPWLPPSGSAQGHLFPPLAILWTLMRCSGLPLLLLAATSPLIQATFASLYPGRDPYRLYAVSNAGSLGGLLSYPFLVEPFLDLRVQAWAATILFLIYLALLFVLLRRVQPPAMEPSGTPSSTVGWADRFRWVGLAGLGTLWLCAVTNQISRDMGSMPLIWIPPLAAYLLTFILVFETRWSFEHPAWRAGLIMIIAALAWNEGAPWVYKALARSWGSSANAILHPLYNHLRWLPGHQPQTVALTVLAGAAGCLLAHARLAGNRPAPAQLTDYYFCISAGGAIGGLFVSIAGPLLFNQDHELGLAMALTGGMVVLSFSRSRTWLRWPGLGFGTLAAGLALFTMLMSSTDRSIFNGRDFFGSFHTEMLHPRIKALYHGSTAHGIQFMAEPLRPASYYGADSGIGIVLRTLNAERPRLRVGLIGLGVGNTAAFGRAGDEYVFFEISPGIIDAAGPNGSQFTVLKTTPATVRVLQGDGRILAQSEAEAHGRYDVLLVDAFAGGHIPAHLLTVEALQGYAGALKPDGLLVLHVSHDLPLDRQVGVNLRAAGLTGLFIPHESIDGKSKSGAIVVIETYSLFWIAARQPEKVLRPEFLRFAKRAVLQAGTRPTSMEAASLAEALIQESSHFQPWTDQRHSLSQLLLSSFRQRSAGEDE